MPIGIQTWKYREAVLAKGYEEESEEGDEPTPIVESPKQAGLGNNSKQVETKAMT